MEELLKEELKENEKLLWTGKPEAFETMDKVYKPALIKKVIMMTVLVAALAVAYVVLANAKGVDLQAWLLILLAACVVGSAVTPFLDAKKLRARTLYAVTDIRIIVVQDTVKDVPFAAIEEAVALTDEAGHTSILCGQDAVKFKASACRAAAASGPRANGENGLCESLVLYAVPEAAKVKEILSKYIPF